VYYISVQQTRLCILFITNHSSVDFQEQKKSKILQESMLKLDAEMKRTDSLLYQMIPKQVADRLRSGEPAISTCEVR